MIWSKTKKETANARKDKNMFNSKKIEYKINKYCENENENIKDFN